MNLEELAQALIDGRITLAEWQAEMREFIRVIHRNATVAALGGFEQVSQSMWGYEGYLVKQQYAFLDRFAAEIAENPAAWLNGRLLTRMEMYGKAEWGTFDAILRRQAQMDGKTQERRVLGQADHCPDCLDYAAEGWQPLGTLPGIGDSQCLTNCRCTFEYK